MGASRVPFKPACIAEEILEFSQLPKAQRDELKQRYQEEQKQKADADPENTGEGSGGTGGSTEGPKEDIEIESKEEFEEYSEEVQKRRYRPPEACHKDLNYT